MKLDLLLITICLFVGPPIFSEPAAADDATKRPNILFILTDDQTPSSIGAYGNQVCSTPNLDQLAARGMRIDQAYHMGAFQGAVCTASRHMIMSGRTVWHIPGATTRSKILQQLNPAQQAKESGPGNPHVPDGLELNTIGAVFNRAGYDTMRTCKKGNSYAAANAQFTVVKDKSCRGVGAEGSAWHADQVLDFLNDREKTKDADPFMIYFGFSHPHDPRNASDEMLAKYGAVNDMKPGMPTNPKAPALPINYLSAHPFPDGHPGLRDEVAVQGVLKRRDEATIRNEKGREYGCIENIDTQIGRVIDKLKSMGELDNTYIIFTADHGIAVGRHGLMGKQNLYEHCWRVPYLVAGPTIKPGTHAKGNIYLLDTLATICDLAGIEIPKTNEGISFKPVLEGKQDTIRDVMYGTYCGGTKPGMRSVRKGDWKLIKYETLDGQVKETQLFNLTENPNELLSEHHAPEIVKLTGNQPAANQVDLAENPKYAEKLREMEALLLSEMERLDDPYRFGEGYTNAKSQVKPAKANNKNTNKNNKDSKNTNKNKKNSQAPVAYLESAPVSPAASGSASRSNPNIIYIICDDLGYGDVQCLNLVDGKIKTPNADQLAKQGMIFTDAHSGASVCTPTRYGVMTGRYSWRTKHQSGVVQGFAPSLIAADRPTVATFLKSQGYQTAAIGKWHLNFQYLDPDTGQAYSQKDHKLPPVKARISDGPVARGFDYYHGFHHARDMEAVIENDRVIEHDPVINMLPRLTKKAVEYINSRANARQPFFLYLPLGSPHTPIVPTDDWKGKSGLGDYGDFVMQTDNVVGEVCKALDENGIADKTLVIFTSDNGCSKAAGIPKLAAQGHKVSADLRGSKADIWDGGHRVPFIVRWPGKVQPGSTCNQLICLTDLFATLSEITASPIPDGSCEDSVSFLPALVGQPIQSSRAGVIHHSISGHFAYRSGNWKLILARASGGWTSPKENEAPDDAPKAQLYDMSSDIGEQHNLYTEKPEIASKLLSQLIADIQNGRSTSGPKSANDIEEIVLWKSEKTDQPAKNKNKKQKQQKDSLSTSNK